MNHVLTGGFVEATKSLNVSASSWDFTLPPIYKHPPLPVNVSTFTC